MRIVSLLPSATEIVCGLLDAAPHAGHALVGISHECDYPASIEGLPMLTRCRLSYSKDSLEIDRSIREILKDALAVYEVDVDGLQALSPDVIVTQDLCDVCAVSYDDVCRAAARVGNPSLQVVSLHPNWLEDIFRDIQTVARALSIDPLPYLTALRARVSAVAARATQAKLRPRFLSIEWLTPVMVGGMWMPEMVTLAGAENLVSRPGAHAPTLDDDALEALAPDVVLIKPCGFSIERTLEERPRVEALCKRFPKARVYIADGNAYFNRPGPRIVDSLEILAAAIHPGLFGPDDRLLRVQ